MDITQIALVVGVIMVSMTLHEVMHGLVAYYLGDDTAKLQGRLTLNRVHISCLSHGRSGQATPL